MSTAASGALGRCFARPLIKRCRIVEAGYLPVENRVIISFPSAEAGLFVFFNFFI